MSLTQWREGAGSNWNAEESYGHAEFAGDHGPGAAIVEPALWDDVLVRYEKGEIIGVTILRASQRLRPQPGG